jgi:hypothetical protein
VGVENVRGYDNDDDDDDHDDDDDDSGWATVSFVILQLEAVLHRIHISGATSKVSFSDVSIDDICTHL